MSTHILDHELISLGMDASAHIKRRRVNIHGAFLFLLLKIQRENAHAIAISLFLWMRDSFGS